MANTTKSIQDILATEGQTLTPYEVFRVLQDKVAALDVQPAKPLRPQFVYNYDRNGMIVKGYNMASRDGLAGRYTVDQAVAWADKYIQGNRSKWTKAQSSAPVDPFAQFSGTDPDENQMTIDDIEIDA